MDILIEELEESLWVAALKDGRLEGLEVDPADEAVRWGSIYHAKVKTIDAAQDAAYVDLGNGQTGILYNRDIRIPTKTGYIKGGEKAIGKTLSPGKAIAVQAKSTYIPQNEDDYLNVKSKLPRVSMDITLPGRYLIYCPLMHENHISKRIRDKALRRKIEKMMTALLDAQGFILRAAAANTQTDMLTREAKILQQKWTEIEGKIKAAASGAGLIMAGPDSIQRTLSDQAAQHIERIEIVTMDRFTQAEEWCATYAPNLITKIQPVELPDATEDLALFYHRDIIGQIEDLFQPYAILPSGGNVILQETAALCAVDVNSGGDKRSRLAVNIEAAQEIARQIRLRNIGGAIVIDFLKLPGDADKKALLTALDKAVGEDPCTVQIHGFTNLGHVEIARKRRTTPLQSRLDDDMF